MVGVNLPKVSNRENSKTNVLILSELDISLF